MQGASLPQSSLRDASSPIRWSQGTAQSCLPLTRKVSNRRFDGRREPPWRQLQTTIARKNAFCTIISYLRAVPAFSSRVRRQTCWFAGRRLADCRRLNRRLRRGTACSHKAELQKLRWCSDVRGFSPSVCADAQTAPPSGGAKERKVHCVLRQVEPRGERSLTLAFL